jgi:Inner membrane component of T3SS, cytoplasmic domain
MPRYRLRFLLQEFDLPQGTIVLGRSHDCHVTIEDALVSRAHAKIEVRGDQALLSDLQSRNGVHINGAPLAGTHTLVHNDRIRIGKQDLVFSSVDTPSPVGKTTGFLRHCGSCRLPYPEEAGTCPNCGSGDVLAEDTLSVRKLDSENKKWQLGFLVGMLRHLIKSDRLIDADRIFQRITVQVDECVGSSQPVADDEWLEMVEAVARFAIALKSASVACWLVRAHQLHHRLPAQQDVMVFATLLRTFLEIEEPLVALATSVEARKDQYANSDSVIALRALIAADRDRGS